ncbi:tetratricopeptide repeat protein [Haloferula chungangensis]|uniref:Tetratricopeptide repeat protein n=1 Tax=Haloferula chungangensis TaxID=1048331 RepID=A0ABW2L2E1_9BACT
MKKGWAVWFWVVLLLVVPGAALRSEETSQPVLGVLAFTTEEGDPDLKRMGFTLKEELRRSFAVSHRVQWRSTSYGRRQLGLKPEESADREQAIEIGRLVEAPRILFGELRRDGGGWAANAELLNTASGEGGKFEVKGADWWALRDGLLREVFARLKIEPDKDAEERIYVRWTSNPEVIPLMARFLEADATGTNLENAEELVNQGLALDEDCGRLWILKAMVLFNLDKPEEADEAMTKAMELEPDLARIKFIRQNIAKLAPGDRKQEFMRCLELEPTNSEVLSIYGGFLIASENELEEAMEVLRKAQELEPRDPMVACTIASCQLRLGNRVAAERSLQSAVTFAAGEPPLINDEANIGHVAKQLGDYPTALKAFRRSIRGARKVGIAQRMIDEIQAMADGVEQRLEANSVKAVRPRDYTTGELWKALASKLDESQLAMVVDPLEVTPEMKAWASKVVEGVDGDEAKARKIFETLAFRPQRPGSGGIRTSRELFEAWDDPELRISCQEHAKLFIVLAREVGLDAYYVLLERDFSGRPVYHACAAVFLGDECYLVDPTYEWFGVPHREFTLVDDVQAVALQMSQEASETEKIEPAEIANFLYPDSAYILMVLGVIYLENDELKRPGECFDHAERVDPGRWDVLLGRAQLSALMEGKPEEIEALLQESLERNPESERVHYFLGLHFVKTRQLAQAREHFRACVRLNREREFGELAGGKLVMLSEMMGDEEESPAAIGQRLMLEGDYEAAALEFEKAVKAKPDSEMLHAELGRAYRDSGKFSEAADQFLKAYRLNEDPTIGNVEHLCALLKKADRFDEGLEIAKEALAKRPDEGQLHALLGSLLLRNLDFDLAEESFEKAIELAPGLWAPRFELAWMQLVHGRMEEGQRNFIEAERVGGPHSSDSILNADSLRLLGRFGEAENLWKAQDASGWNEESVAKHVAQKQHELSAQVAAEKELIRILGDGNSQEEKEHLSVLSEIVCSCVARDEEVQDYFALHQEELRQLFLEREMTTISVAKGDGARKRLEEIRQGLIEGRSVEEMTEALVAEGRVHVGARVWNLRDDLVELLQGPVFEAEIGGVTELIEGPGHWFLVSVHDRRGGKELTLEDGNVKQAVEKRVLEERRKEWESWYLKELGKRLADERRK